MAKCGGLYFVPFPHSGSFASPFPTHYLYIGSAAVRGCQMCRIVVAAWLTHCQPTPFGTVLAIPRVAAVAKAASGKQKEQQLKNKRTMNIRPLADRVLVLPAPAEEKVGGIIIPDTAKEKPLHGTIVAAGKGTKDEEMVLKEGDEVLYGKYSGTELEYDGTKYLMMRQSDVLAIIEK